ncbi:uncharacterized protein A4U43_C03F2020 [Asparagus officinalis]|uniref:Protein kinase domain-containing protein n=1 Tax=Asparagus officinalis TaxID=4686 RepID=A0A5P1F6L6_ASPOF|nr:uncharacterized protein A4U43_C03F2020 [Asparagus officinalis]
MLARGVLIDEEYEHKVSDFGLARLMRPWTSDEGLNTTPFLNGNFGEFGYIAPKYATNPVPSTKGDVYGFGVVLLELATEQKATEVSRDGSAYQLVVAGKIREVIHKQSIEPWLKTKKPPEKAKGSTGFTSAYSAHASCSTACPAYWWDPEAFVGPAALLRAYRWIPDM